MRITKRKVITVGKKKLPVRAEFEAWEGYEKGECVSMKGLAITGSDLIAAGMKPGKVGKLCSMSFWMLFWRIRI